MQPEHDHASTTIREHDLPEPEFEAMQAVSPFTLAEWWATRSLWSVFEYDEPEIEVLELAVMSALGQWLHRWLPRSIHRALRDGASLDAVATAVGINTSGVFLTWTQWAVQQRALHDQISTAAAPIGLSETEYEQVRAVFHPARTRATG